MFVLSSQKNDTTLRLPRMLCLHGGGTNSRIFRMQCRVLERALKQWFRLVYAEAPFPAQPGSDVTSVYKDHGPFKAWLQTSAHATTRDNRQVIEDIDTAITTAMCVDDLKGATGEWVALLGFSQGAKIAASMLYAQQDLQRKMGLQAEVWPNFRFAILLAGRGPLVWLEPDTLPPEGLVDAAELSTSSHRPLIPLGSTKHVLHIPTIHVHGVQDPGLELHRELYEKYCDPGSTILLEWQGNHRVPIRTLDVKAVLDAVYFMAVKTGVLDLFQE
ncbi:unnamed protein product [Aureobasidium mustum]|uniref:Serine hydrolase domain-containing protein n=1 Tax=Aureobasidium mustum TaxID=2773714 RepID=A0A9N8K6S6_9PEZI|nr:unnamed protein product [Aureobasidium mustum]